MTLEELRKQIDALDDELFSAYIKRVGLVGQIGDYKREHSLPVENAAREEEVYSRLEKKFGSEYADDARILYFAIMSLSKRRQVQKEGELYNKASDFTRGTLAAKGLKIACQGVEGANSHAAALRAFNEPQVVFEDSFEDVFRAVDAGEADFGLVPVENSTAGSVYETYDLLNSFGLFIVKAVRERISHCLLAKKGVSQSDIKTVCSHPQALRQCSEFIKRNGFKTRECSNTALAAKLVSDGDCAAICSSQNAEIYNLEIIAKDVQDEKQNYTRFIAVAKKNIVTDDADKISLILTLEHKPYTLCRLLNLIASEGLNLQKIESRPIPGKNFEFTFYLDIDGNLFDKNVQNLLKNIDFYCKTVKFLGCYNEKKP